MNYGFFEGLFPWWQTPWGELDPPDLYFYNESMSSRFKIRVAVVLPWQGKLLLCQQNHYSFWVLPGGTLEPGEGIADCAVRELEEETGLSITLDKLLYTLDWISPHKQVHEVYFLGRWAGGALLQDSVENIQRLQLFTPTEFETLWVEPKPVAQAISQDWSSQFIHSQGKVLGSFYTR